MIFSCRGKARNQLVIHDLPEIYLSAKSEKVQEKGKDLDKELKVPAHRSPVKIKSRGPASPWRAH